MKEKKKKSAHHHQPRRSANSSCKREGKYLDYGVDFISQSRWWHAVNDIEIWFCLQHFLLLLLLLLLLSPAPSRPFFFPLDPKPSFHRLKIRTQMLGTATSPHTVRHQFYHHHRVTSLPRTAFMLLFVKLESLRWLRWCGGAAALNNNNDRNSRSIGGGRTDLLIGFYWLRLGEYRLQVNLLQWWVDDLLAD